LIGRTNLGRPSISVPRITKCYVENLIHFLPHKIPDYGMRHLGLEGVYRDQLETRLNFDLGQVRRAIYTRRYKNDGSDCEAIVKRLMMRRSDC
jgi:hypothetical protein